MKFPKSKMSKIMGLVSISILLVNVFQTESKTTPDFPKKPVLIMARR